MKFKNYFYKIIIIVLFIVVTYVTYCSIFNIYMSKEDLKPFILILGTIVMIASFIRIKKYLKKIPENKSDIIAIIVSVSFFIMLAVFGNKFSSIPTYDLSNVIKEATYMIHNGGKFVTEEYFSVYSNQIPITVCIYYIFKLGSIINIENLKSFATIMNSLFISITAFFTYLSVKKLKNHKYGLMTLLFFIVNPAFYLYSSYFYTDTLCMPFAAIAIYLFIIYKNNETERNKLLMLISSGIILAVGFKIRVVIGILLIAMIMSILLAKDNKKTISILTILVSFIVGYFGCNILEKSTNPIINENKKFPATHWLMIGSNYKTDGRWNIDDYKYTEAGKTYSEKRKKDIEEIEKRIQKLGATGVVSLIKKKLSVNWSNGSYDYLAKFINVEEINPLYEYITGNKKIFLTYYYQICKITILLLFLIALIEEIRNDEGINSKYNFIYISIFGGFLFYIIWEVLTRYSLTFLPWMILMFGVGIDEIEKYINIDIINLVSNNNKNLNIFITRIKKYIAISTMMCSIFLLIINYNEYAIRKKIFYDKRVVQGSSEQGQLIPKISNKKIEQTFKTDKAFNHIEIRFNKKNTSEETHYTFILKDENGKELVKQSFSSNSIENDKYKGFDFKKIKPKGNKKYTFQISSNDANNSNSIGIATFCQEKYDVYPNGNINIDGEIYEADMTFVVHNVVTRTYVSKKVYLFLSFLIIIIEIFAFYPFLTYNRSVKEIEGGI